MSCKKDPNLNQNNYTDFCTYYNTPSTDISYTPHKKGNDWSYCSGDLNIAGWSGGIILDTLINNKMYFTRQFDTYSTHAFPKTIICKSIIDSIGNYFELTIQSGYIDTLLLIKLNALSGDTIYNNIQSHVKVVVINTNETLESCNNCYHSKVIYPNTVEHHYFKKGIGDLTFFGFKLYNATIK
jgi:hypothetical protein